MDFSNIADAVLNKQGGSQGIISDSFSVESAPGRIMQLHPAIYKFRGQLYHEHGIIKPGDIYTLYELIDLPDADLSKPQAIWIYNRLLEMAKTFSDRIIVLNNDYVWDKHLGRVIPLELLPFESFSTMSDKTSLEIARRKVDEQ